MDDNDHIFVAALTGDLLRADPRAAIACNLTNGKMPHIE